MNLVLYCQSIVFYNHHQLPEDGTCQVGNLSPIPHIIKLQLQKRVVYTGAWPHIEMSMCLKERQMLKIKVIRNSLGIVKILNDYS